MKKSHFFFFALLCMIVAACKGGSQKSNPKHLPTPGALMDSAAMKITNDQLNDFIFSVTVRADSQVKDGVYAIRAAYGFDVANGTFTMPKGLEDYKLSLRKGTSAYTYIIGFLVPDDTTFHDYFEVAGTKTSISMKYLKSYTYQ